MKSPAQRGYLDLRGRSPALEAMTGRYFINPQVKRTAKQSYDEITSARLW